MIHRVGLCPTGLGLWIDGIRSTVLGQARAMTGTWIHHEERWGGNPICEPRVTKRGKGITNGRDIDSDEESAERREGEKIAHQHGKPRGMWEYVAIKRPWVKTI